MKIIQLLSISLVIILLSACGFFKPPPPDIAFAEYDEPYASKMSLARVEHEYPLSIEDRMEITPENLAVLSQEQVDQIYARLTAGPIPDGAFEGGLFFPKGSSGKSRLVEVIKGDKEGLKVKLRGLVVKRKMRKIEALGHVLWKGKVFYKDERVLRNRIEDLAALKPLIDGSILDIPKINVDHKDAWLMFPAKLYCGQSLLDGRRESIIIDYAFTDEIEGYRQRPDYLAGRNAFQVRDEIRMVRPGFYIGRAYLQRFFVLNFTLYNKKIAKQSKDNFLKKSAVTEDCWSGEQQRLLTVQR